jgi:hypothetical protein
MLRQIMRLIAIILSAFLGSYSLAVAQSAAPGRAGSIDAEVPLPLQFEPEVPLEIALWFSELAAGSPVVQRLCPGQRDRVA